MNKYSKYPLTKASVYVPINHSPSILFLSFEGLLQLLTANTSAPEIIVHIPQRSASIAIENIQPSVYYSIEPDARFQLNAST